MKNMLKKKLPLSAHIILLIIANLWLIWSFHVVLFDTNNQKLLIANPFNPNISTMGKQWPCYYLKKQQFVKQHAETLGLQHYEPVKVNIFTVINCSGVCQLGRLGILITIVLMNIIYFPNSNLIKNKNIHKGFSIFGWVLLGINAFSSLILNWPLFIRALPGFLILLVLQFNLMLDGPNGEEPTDK